MSAKRSTLYATTDAPVALTTVYTSTGNTHFDKATVLNDTGGAITLDVTIAGIPVYAAYSVAAATEAESLDHIVNHGMDAGEVIQVNASAANLNMLISGRDF